MQRAEEKEKCIIEPHSTQERHNEEACKDARHMLIQPSVLKHVEGVRMRATRGEHTHTDSSVAERREGGVERESQA